jgi:hypothetical protein
MLITEQFAWAHLPKAAGDATRSMFVAVPGLVQYADSPDSNDKHDPFALHSEAIAGRLRVMNIRRLPAWILSASHHRAAAGKRADFEPQPMPTVDEMAENTAAGDMLRHMTAGPRFPVDRWLRKENLTEDVIALLAEIGSLTDAARAAIDDVPYRAQEYDHDLSSTFTAEQVRRMYTLNPGWAEIEERVYGDLHELARDGYSPSAGGRLSTALRGRTRAPNGRARRGRRAGREEASARFGTESGDADEIPVDGWLTSLHGPELEALDRRIRETGARLEIFALFRDLDDDLWALLLGRRHSSYPSILDVLPHLPDPSLQQRWEGAHGLTLLTRSKAFYRHARAIYEEYGDGDYHGTRILDFGCGWGRLTRFFARDVAPGALHGCDPDEEMLEICRRSRVPAVLHRSAYLPDALPEGNFDLAFSASAFTRIPAAAADTCLRALHAALNPGGLLILTVPPPGKMKTAGEAVIGLPHIRDRWGESFELLDAKVRTEAVDQAAITLRKR